MKRLLLLVFAAFRLQAITSPVPMPHVQFFDTSGRPLAAGYVYTYVAGTTTPLDSYTDASGTTPNSNPIVLDASGSAMIWVSAAAYKIVVQNKFHSVQWSADNVQAGAGGGGGGCGISSPCSILQGGTGATTATGATTNLQYAAPYAGAVAVSDTTRLAYDVYVGDGGADPTGATDSTTAFQYTSNTSATRAGATVRIPCGTYKITSPITVANTSTSWEGESSSCVVINYTGTTDGPFKFYTFAGSIGGMTIKVPNGTGVANSYGIRTNAVQSRIHDIVFAQCTAAVGIRVDSGDGAAPAVMYFNGNDIVNISGSAAILIQIKNTGVAPTTGFFYAVANSFHNILPTVTTGQTGIYVGGAWIFERNKIDIDCGMSNQGAAGDFYCLTSGGDWKNNTLLLQGEYNNSFGGTGTAYGLNLLSTGVFSNNDGFYNIRLLTTVTPGVSPYAALLPVQNAGTAVAPFWPTTNEVAAPSGTCRNGTLWTQSTTGALYVCQSSAWVAK